MAYVTMKELLEAGVHFGHQTNKWNPKMRPYIFASRKGIHIIDLQKTIECFDKAYEFVEGMAAQGKTILFVCTKKQGQEDFKAAAEECGMPHVTEKWIGGLLTNFPTVRKSVEKLIHLEDMEANGEFERLTKKEAKVLRKKKEKLSKKLSGIRDMTELPDAGIIVDINREIIAVKEFRKMGVPTVALVDTNCDPELVDYIIPGNDDAIRSIKLLAQKMAEAIKNGRARWEKEMAEEKEEERIEEAIEEKLEAEEDAE